MAFVINHGNLYLITHSHSVLSMQGVAQVYGLLYPRFIVPEIRFTGFNLTLATGSLSSALCLLSLLVIVVFFEFICAPSV